MVVAFDWCHWKFGLMRSGSCMDKTNHDEFQSRFRIILTSLTAADQLTYHRRWKRWLRENGTFWWRCLDGWMSNGLGWEMYLSLGRAEEHWKEIKSNQIQFHCNQLASHSWGGYKTHSRTTSLRILHVGNLLVQLEMRPPDAGRPQPTQQYPRTPSTLTDGHRPTYRPTYLLNLSHLLHRSMWKP